MPESKELHNPKPQKYVKRVPPIPGIVGEILDSIMSTPDMGLSPGLGFAIRGPASKVVSSVLRELIEESEEQFLAQGMPRYEALMRAFFKNKYPKLYNMFEKNVKFERLSAPHPYNARLGEADNFGSGEIIVDPFAAYNYAEMANTIAHETGHVFRTLKGISKPENYIYPHQNFQRYFDQPEEVAARKIGKTAEEAYKIIKYGDWIVDQLKKMPE